MHVKKSLLVGATIATVSLGGIGGVSMVSAATDTSAASTSGSSSTTSAKTSLIDKLAAKFNLNKDEVKAVFDADRSERQADIQAAQAKKLAQAVTDGKLTQAQADYITKAQAEIAALRGTGSKDSQSTTDRDAIKAKMDALKTWATDNKVDTQYIMGGMHGGGRGMGGPRADMPPTTN